jgi:predicted metalloprotease with PDZ domain
VKLYIPTADSGNRFPSYYLKGGVIFALLDMTIIAESDGAKSLDDGMRALMDRYIANPADGITEEEFIDIVSGATGIDIGERLRRWLSSTDELPVEDVVARLGLEWRTKSFEEVSKFGDDREFQKPSPKRWTGMSVEETKTGVKIAKVVRQSPAEEAGIGADDELIALNGIRVTTPKQWEALLQVAVGKGEVAVTAASEGKMYETTLRLDLRDNFELVEKGEMSEEEKKRLEKWLSR